MKKQVLNSQRSKSGDLDMFINKIINERTKRLMEQMAGVKSIVRAIHIVYI